MKKSFFVANLLMFSMAYAEEIEKNAEDIKQVLNNSVYEPNYFGMVLGLFVVIGLIYITGFLYQKLTKVNIGQNNLYINKPQIISSTSLGQNKNLYVVKVGDEAMLVASTQNSITYLKDVKIIEKEEKLNNDKNSKDCQ